MKNLILFLITVTLIIASVVYVVFSYGTEFLSKFIADIIPIEIEQQIGQVTLQAMEMQSLEESALPFFVQNKIRDKFFQLVNKDSSAIKIIFRNAPYPNAFAIPGNYIIVSDSLVKMSIDTNSYEDVLGVLAHEMGHLHFKHSLRLMIKSGLTAAIIGYLIGDFSSFMATATHQLISLSYSRDFEKQADVFAINLLKKNNLSTVPLAQLLEKISSLKQDKEIPEFLSTHPITKERVRKLKETDN